MILSIILLATCLLMRLDVASGCFGKSPEKVLKTIDYACDTPEKPFNASTIAYNLLNLTMQPQVLLGEVPKSANFRVDSASIKFVGCESIATGTKSAPCNAQMRYLIVKKKFLTMARSHKPLSLNVMHVDPSGFWLLSYRDVNLSFTFTTDEQKPPSICEIMTDDIDDEQLKSIFSQLKVSSKN